MSNVIANYFGIGTIAARPTTPLVAAGCSAFYFAADTGHLYCWAGAWKTII